VPFQWVECCIESRHGNQALVRIKTLLGPARYEVKTKDVAVAIEPDGATRHLVACRSPRQLDHLLAVTVPGKRCRGERCEQPTVIPLTAALFNPNGHQAVVPLPS
jgi:hypothetical protein